jgi:hypothetical protein
MFYLGLIAGTVVGFGFVRYGMWQGKRLAKPDERVKYTCDCDHLFSSHKDGGTGKCTVQYFREHSHTPYSNCSCLFYIGPKPPPDYTDFIKEVPTDVA